MKLTKYEHACLVIDNGQSKLVIDPGDFAQLPGLTNVAAVVITHGHFDHYNQEKIQKLCGANPEVQIFMPVDMTLDLPNVTNVDSPKQLNVGGFKISLTPVDHAAVYQKSPCQNLTVTVDDYLYYPGDSFVNSGAKVHILALPISGPWLKTSEIIDFAKANQSEYVLATHNALNSETGDWAVKSWLEKSNALAGRTYLELAPGQIFAD